MTAPPGQRRFDALMTMLRRAVAGSRGQPTTARATVLVTIDLEVLQRMVADGAGGNVPGCGQTVDGATITAAAIRRPTPPGTTSCGWSRGRS